MRTNSFSKILLSLTLLWFCASGVSAQIVQKFGDNSNTINDKAVLEIESTTKGFLLPRMTKAQRGLITNPPEGLMLWCTDCSFSKGSEIVVWVKDSWTGLLISNLGNNSLLLGNADGEATAVTFSGDVTIDNAGVSTIGTSKVLSSMILDGTLIAADIAEDAVITSKILDANVSNEKLDKINIPLSGFGIATADIELGGHKITGLAAPTDADDAATKNYVDNGIAGMNTLASGKVYLGNSGNVATEVTLSGDVTIDNAGVSAIGTSKVLSSMILDGTLITADIANNAVVTSKILDANVTNAKLDKINIPLSGFGVATAAIELGDHKLTGLAEPTDEDDAATKNYVDNANATNADLTGAITSIGNTTSLGSFTSANLASALNDETGTASVVLSDSPTLTGTITTAAINAISITASKTLGITGATSLTTLAATGLATLNSAAITTSLDVAGVTKLNDRTASSSTTTGALTVAGGVGIIKNLNVGGDLKVAGDIALSTVNTSGLATLNSAAITGNTTIGGTLEVTGKTSLTTLATTGPTTLNSVLVTTTATINDLDVTTNIDAATLATSGLATLNTVAITNSLDVAGVTNLKNTTESTTPINGSLIVFGGTGIAKNLNVGGAMGVTGATNLSTLSTSGLATLYKGAIITNASIGGTLGVTGVATLAAQPILQTLDPSLPVFTDDKRGLVSNPVSGTENVVMSKSATLTGVPLAPTAELSTNTTQIATTAFVLSNSDQYYSVSESSPISTMASTDEAIMSMTSESGGTYAVNFNAQYNIDPTDRTGVAANDLAIAYNLLMAKPNTETMAAAIPAKTFTPGVYYVPSAGTIAASLLIKLNGSGTYIFKFAAAFSVGANTEIILENGAEASEVFWIAEGAVAIGADAKMKGSLISNSGAVSLGEGASVEGKMLAVNNGAVNISRSPVINTGSSSTVNWGGITSFAMFSNGGIVSNALASTVNGNIGTRSGSVDIASFAPATVNGDFYTSLVGPASTSFSLYQNNVLIPNSTRMRSSTLNTVDVSLQAIAIVPAGGNIAIKCRTDSGTVTLNNRILTAIRVR
jgi:hypothetical protein